MIAIIDYGVGNLFSLSSSLSFLGLKNEITNDAGHLSAATHIILPGVGAFGDAMEKLRATGLIDTIKAEAAAGKPLLGICLGMQLLFEKSYEYGEHEGLSLIPGEIAPLEKEISLKVPHIGWNSLDFVPGCPLLRGIKPGDYVYYVHSYYLKNSPSVIATSKYEVDIPGVVQHTNIFGCQFHPEKSGEVGLKILRAFGEIQPAESPLEKGTKR